ncbi:hypothetical protein ZHAS_00007370 [Anopheles sinensis]|uniref:Uncharacterized protein n=1 Tax=Anopheles sinensis TaxID=74873 RepID=A0A084VPT9_ANOSI|nr:hypothetical protein ZHAS_00007370 [Anopheles sinensis]
MIIHHNLHPRAPKRSFARNPNKSRAGNCSTDDSNALQETNPDDPTGRWRGEENSLGAQYGRLMARTLIKSPPTAANNIPERAKGGGSGGRHDDDDEGNELTALVMRTHPRYPPVFSCNRCRTNDGPSTMTSDKRETARPDHVGSSNISERKAEETGEDQEGGELGKLVTGGCYSPAQDRRRGVLSPKSDDAMTMADASMI